MLWEGVRVDRWIVEEVVGEGATAVVYRAHDPATGDVVALKVPAFPTPASLALFAGEVRCHRRVQHPNVVGLRGELVVGALRVMVLDYVEGQNLAEFFAQNPSRKDKVEEIAAGLIAGVGAIHGQKIVHRDLKPGNVLLHIEGERIVPRIIDFGLARLLTNSAPQTSATTVIGTPGYMAPEQFRDADRVGPSADIFSLGVLLYELVCGAPPFAGDTFRTLNDIAAERYVRPRRLADIPERMEAAILGALRPDPERRIPDCATLWAVWSGEEATGAWAPPPLSPIETMGVPSVAQLGARAGSEPTIIPDFPDRSAPPWPPPLAEAPSPGSTAAAPPTPAASSGLRAPIVAGVAGLLIGAAALLVLVPPTPPQASVPPAPVAAPAPVEAPEPAPIARTMSLASVPAGARVLEGGTELGVTPYSWPDDGRPHTLKLQLDGFTALNVDIAPNDPTAAREVRLVRIPAAPRAEPRPASSPKPEARKPVQGIKTSR